MYVVGTVNGPVYSRMYHHVTGPIENHLNIMLSNCILVLGSNPREGFGLNLGNAVLLKNAGIIDTIVTVVVLDCHASKIPVHLFKPCFTHNSLAYSHACLAFNIDKVGGSICVKSTAIIRLCLGPSRPYLSNCPPGVQTTNRPVKT